MSVILKKALKKKMGQCSSFDRPPLDAGPWLLDAVPSTPDAGSQTPHYAGPRPLPAVRT